MSTTINELFEPGPQERRALGRTLQVSFGLHIAAALVLFLVPRDWIGQKKPENVMMISLGGTPGPSTTGSTPISAKRPDDTPPPTPPKRPEPDRPTPAQPVTAPVQMVPAKPPKTPEKPTTAEVPMVARPSAPSPRTMAGNSPVQTQGVTNSPGLTWGGGDGSGERDIKDFCCPAYLQMMLNAIKSNWHQELLTDRQMTWVSLTILRDATITDVQTKTTSGNRNTDLVAVRAVTDTRRLPPLPPEYKYETLQINIGFDPNGKL